MKIKIFYENGQCREFDPSLFTTAEPFKGEGSGKSSGMPRNNVMTEVVYRGDLLYEKGLALQLFWYNTVIDEQTSVFHDAAIEHDVRHAGREVGRIITLASLEELRSVVKITLDDEIVAIRQNNQLINVMKFAVQELLYSNSTPSASLATRVMELYRYKKNSSPSLTDEAIAFELGFPIEAFEHIRACEESQPDEDDGTSAFLALDAPTETEPTIGVDGGEEDRGGREDQQASEENEGSVLAAAFGGDAESFFARFRPDAEDE